MAYEFNKDAKYPAGGVYPATDVELTHTSIRVTPSGAFLTQFPNVFEKYRLPYVESDAVVQSWSSAPMQFWQNQLNFAVWRATSGCGVSSQHLNDADPMARAVFRFHAYYQIRRILKEIGAALPQDQGWGAFVNAYDVRAYERVCAEFGVSPHTDWRVHGLNKGIGFVYDYWTNIGYHKHPDLVYDPKGYSFTQTNTRYIAHIDYIAQDEGFAGWQTFILDRSQGFTRPGVERVNGSIRTYVWTLLGAQAQIRTRILGTGTAFDAQKQYLALVEDAISSTVDLAAAIKRYQDILQNASSRVDYVYGAGLYMSLSDMLLRIGQTEGYNNMIVVANPGMKRGLNIGVNEVHAPPAPPPPAPQQPAHHEPEALPPPQPHPNTTAGGKVAALLHHIEKTALIVGGVAVGLVVLWFR